MTNKPTISNKTNAATTSKAASNVCHPGMMGDGTEEQNLNEKGNPAARITEKEVEVAFGKDGAKKSG
ncbi:hypothetical protein HUU61_17850 [Rhodopseudomonas palustris]|nr:hypothetical protein [Rhodopseudomonas palustris]